MGSDPSSDSLPCRLAFMRAQSSANCQPSSGFSNKVAGNSFDRFPYIRLKDELGGIFPGGFKVAGRIQKPIGNLIHNLDVTHQYRLIGTRHQANEVAWRDTKAVSLLRADAHERDQDARQYLAVRLNRWTTILATPKE
jgi:hypothetical protein